MILIYFSVTIQTDWFHWRQLIENKNASYTVLACPSPYFLLLREEPWFSFLSGALVSSTRPQIILFSFTMADAFNLYSDLKVENMDKRWTICYKLSIFHMLSLCSQDRCKRQTNRVFLEKNQGFLLCMNYRLVVLTSAEVLHVKTKKIGLEGDRHSIDPASIHTNIY